MDLVCGIDEAGRGCIAGSMFVCGILCKIEDLRGLEKINDSKKLTRRQRDEIYLKALNLKIPYFVAKFEASEIDNFGISYCLKNALLSIKNHFDDFSLKLNVNFNDDFSTNLANNILKNTSNISIKESLKSNIKYIFDGNSSFGVSGIECLIKGDSFIPQISLASIFAKSLKDKESDELDKIYPQYKLAKHKGYGTKEHIELIKIHKLSPIHRASFKIKSLENQVSGFYRF